MSQLLKKEMSESFFLWTNTPTKSIKYVTQKWQTFTADEQGKFFKDLLAKKSKLSTKVKTVALNYKLLVSIFHIWVLAVWDIYLARLTLWAMTPIASRKEFSNNDQ